MDSLARSSVFLVFVTLLASCAIAPGFDAPDVPGVTIQPISSDLIRSQQVDGKELEDQKKTQLMAVKKNKNAYRYHIGRGDVLDIMVWEHPEFSAGGGSGDDSSSAGYIVDKDGTIFFPYVGTIKVAGKTTSAVRSMITQALEAAITKPQVNVKVADFRSKKVYLAGEVEEPGQKPITDVPMTVVDAIGLAGGPTENADVVNVTLTRGDNVSTIDLLAIHKDGDVVRNVLLQDGDILHVPNSKERKVYVIGEVLEPSSLLMDKQTMTLTEAINDVGSVNPFTSDPGSIYVIRGTPEDTQIYFLDASTPAALVLGDHFQLQPRDVVYVDTSGVTRWNRVITQILPSIRFLQPPSVFGGS
jgi:polysaccharide export outer membrane protein